MERKARDSFTDEMTQPMTPRWRFCTAMQSGSIGSRRVGIAGGLRTGASRRAPPR